MPGSRVVYASSAHRTSTARCWRMTRQKQETLGSIPGPGSASLERFGFAAARMRNSMKDTMTVEQPENRRQQQPIVLRLNQRQLVAMQFPCWRAVEASQRRYFVDHGNNWRSLVTVNK